MFRPSLRIARLNALMAGHQDRVIPVNAIIRGPEQANASDYEPIPLWSVENATVAAAKRSPTARADTASLRPDKADSLAPDPPARCASVPVLTVDELVFGPFPSRPPRVRSGWLDTVAAVTHARGPCPSVVVLDVNGGEGDVLRGATRLLRQCRPVLRVRPPLDEDPAPMLNQLVLAGYRVAWDAEPRGRLDDRFVSDLQSTLWARSRGGRNTSAEEDEAAVQAASEVGEWFLHWLAVPIQKRALPSQPHGVLGRWEEALPPVDGSRVGVGGSAVRVAGHRSWWRRWREWRREGIPLFGGGPESGVEPSLETVARTPQRVKREEELSGVTGWDAWFPGLEVWNEGVDGRPRLWRLWRREDG